MQTKHLDKSAISPWRILWSCVKSVGGQHIFVGYVLFIILCCVAFCLLEPETFTSFGEAVWYCFQAVTTIGFGDITPTHPICRVLSIIIGLSALLIVALLASIFVNYFTRRMQIANSEGLAAFGDRMEHLTELSDEELAELEGRFKAFAKRHGL